MSVQLYLVPFISSFLVSALLTASLLYLHARKNGVIWEIFQKAHIFFFASLTKKRLGDRHIHKEGVMRLGGVALIVSFLVMVFANRYLMITMPLIGVIVASGAILVVGVWDDMREMSWKRQLGFQFGLAALMFVFGIQVNSLTHPFGGVWFFDAPEFLWLSFIIGTVWMVAVVNAVNWADGIDGWCGGLACIGFLTIFFLSLQPEVNQPPVAILSLMLAGSSLGFLVFNFYPSKIMAGTSGAWFFGFMLAILAIFSGTKIATSLLVLSIPFADAIRVMFERWRSGASLFLPDHRHLHYRLREWGWSEKQIAIFLYSVTIGIAAIALNTRSLGKLVTIVTVCVFSGIIFFWMHKKSVSEGKIIKI